MSALLVALSVLPVAALVWYLLTHVVFPVGGRLYVTRCSGDLVTLREQRWGNATCVLIGDQERQEAMLISPGIGSALLPVHRARTRVLRDTLRAWNVRITRLWIISGYPVYWGVGKPLLALLDPSCTVTLLPNDHAMLLDMDAFVDVMEARAQRIGAHFREKAWVRRFYRTWPLYRRLLFGPGIQRRLDQFADPPRQPFTFGAWQMEPLTLWGDGAELSLILTNRTTGKRVGIVGAIVPPERGIPRDDLPACYLPGSSPVKALESLRQLAARNLHILIPVHGAPIVGADIIRQRLNRMIRQTQLVINTICRLHRENPDWSAAKLADEAFVACGYPNSRLFGRNERQMWVRAIVNELFNATLL